MTLEDFDTTYEHTNDTPKKRARLSEHGYDQGASVALKQTAALQAGEHLETNNERDQRGLEADIAAQPREKVSFQHLDRSLQQADLEEDLEGADQDNAQLTVTVQLGLQTLSERKQAVDAQLEELANEGLQFLETLKQTFLTTISRVKDEFENYHVGQKESWMELSAEYREAKAKVVQVENLVARLNAATCFKCGN